MFGTPKPQFNAQNSKGEKRTKAYYTEVVE